MDPLAPVMTPSMWFIVAMVLIVWACVGAVPVYRWLRARKRRHFVTVHFGQPPIGPRKTLTPDEYRDELERITAQAVMEREAQPKGTVGYKLMLYHANALQGALRLLGGYDGASLGPEWAAQVRDTKGPPRYYVTAAGVWPINALPPTRYWNLEGDTMNGCTSTSGPIVGVPPHVADALRACAEFDQGARAAP